MALSVTASLTSRLRPSSVQLRQPSASFSVRHVQSLRLRRACTRAAAVEAAPSLGPAITLTDKALSHLKKLRADQNRDLLLRIGVRQGGCSGFSYVMDFEERGHVKDEDSIVDYEGFSMVCDPKSLLYLFGMQLDYSDALIGGGFSFSNPNASSTCGCGKSFAA